MRSAHHSVYIAVPVLRSHQGRDGELKWSTLSVKATVIAQWFDNDVNEALQLAQYSRSRSIGLPVSQTT
jgi:hypothetical protein